MGTKTGIEWTDVTWNPMTGCTKISAGCDNCYAYVVAQHKTREVYLRRLPVKDTAANREDPFAPRFWEDRLEQPLRWRDPKRVFVNSMSDVFHAHITFEMIERVFDVMNRASQHQFQILTKRPERALRYAHRLNWGANIWIGTSVENMQVAERVDSLRAIEQAHVRFISAEPLLGPLDKLDLSGVHWVIGGRGKRHRGEELRSRLGSGAARPVQPGGRGFLLEAVGRTHVKERWPAARRQGVERVPCSSAAGGGMTRRVQNRSICPVPP